MSDTSFEQAPAFRVVYSLGFAPSYGEARRLIRNGVVTLNGKPLDDETTLVSPADKIVVRGHINAVA